MVGRLFTLWATGNPINPYSIPKSRQIICGRTGTRIPLLTPGPLYFIKQYSQLLRVFDEERMSDVEAKHKLWNNTNAIQWLLTCVNSTQWLCIIKLKNMIPNAEKAMATHSSILVWKIPWTEKLGRLQSMGSRRVRHDWVTSLWLFTFMHWRRQWHPTPVLLPGKSHGRGSLVGCRLWGRTESDTTEVT